MLRDKPYLMVQVKMSGCVYDVRFNDVSLVSDSRGWPLEADIPVNHWAQSGTNVLAMYLKPVPEDPPTDCSVALMVHKSGSSPKIAQSIADLRFSGALREPSAGFTGSSPAGRLADKTGFPSAPETGEVLIGEIQVSRTEDGAVHLSRSITIHPSLPRWAWLQSESIQGNDETRQKLIAEYQRIWDAVQQKKVPLILPLFAERNKELAAALYRNERDMAQRIKRLEEASVDSSLSLYALEPEDAELVVLGDGRLVKLSRWDGLPMIIFNHVDDSGSEAFDIIFRKAGSRWIITR